MARRWYVIRAKSGTEGHVPNIHQSPRLRPPLVVCRRRSIPAMGPGGHALPGAEGRRVRGGVLQSYGAYAWAKACPNLLISCPVRPDGSRFICSAVM